MDIQVRQADYTDVEKLRELYRQEANCQIIHDSALRRKIADPYLIHIDGRLAGYAGVFNKYHPRQLMEFYTLPHVRAHALPMYREVLRVSGATHLEAQTNMPLMLVMLYDCGTNITRQAILFEDAITTRLECPAGIFRRLTSDDVIATENRSEPPGDYGIEVNGEIVASGGFLTHYNPPCGDIYMEVNEPERKQGYGSYLVQELKRVCYEAGYKPTARTGPNNIASRHTLQKAGFLPCGYLLEAEVASL